MVSDYDKGVVTPSILGQVFRSRMNECRCEIPSFAISPTTGRGLYKTVNHHEALRTAEYDRKIPMTGCTVGEIFSAATWL